MPLVDILARQIRRQIGAFADYDELRSAGQEGLLSAARSFDPERGVPFRRWANLRIRGTMMDAVRSRGEIPRRVYRKLRAIAAADRIQETTAEEVSANPPTSAEAADQKVGDYLAQAATAMAVGFLSMRGSEDLASARDERESAEDTVAREEIVRLVRAAIDERPEQERHLLVRHYFDDLTIDDAAREIGLSKSWGSRLHARAIEGVTKALRRGGVKNE